MDVIQALINLKKQLAIIEKKTDDTLASLQSNGNVKTTSIDELASMDWRDFDVQFNELDFDFAHKIYHTYDNLTMAEYRICQLIKINLKNKEIGDVLGLSIRTVETHRLNIRKKMRLKKGENLSLIINSMENNQ